MRPATLLASVAYLFFRRSSSAISLLLPMLETLLPLAESLSQPPLNSSSTSSSAPRTSNYRYLSTSLSTLTRLCTSHPILFVPHLDSLIILLPALYGHQSIVGLHLQSDDLCLETVVSAIVIGRQKIVFSPPSQPSDTSLPSLSSTFNLHPDQNSTEDGEKDDEHDERSTLRLSALEFMISLSKARPNMVRKVRGWTDIIVRACLEGKEFDAEETEISGLETLLREGVSIFFLFVFLRLNCGVL